MLFPTFHLGVRYIVFAFDCKRGISLMLLALL